MCDGLTSVLLAITGQNVALAVLMMIAILLGWIILALLRAQRQANTEMLRMGQASMQIAIQASSGVSERGGGRG